MSDGVVICHDCEHTGHRGYGKSRFRQCCNHCAQTCRDNHHRETGHQDIELRNVAEPTINNLQRDIRTANLIARRNGW